MPKKIFTKNWKGREEGEDPGKDGTRKQEEIFKSGCEKMRRVGGRQEKMEEHCSTGQSPQWAVVSMDEEEEEEEGQQQQQQHRFESGDYTSMTGCPKTFLY